MNKKVVITGCLGQTGSYLVEQYLAEGFKVHGVYRRISSGANFTNIQDAYGAPNLNLIEGDINDASFINKTISELKPDICINTAAQSNVGFSFKEPINTFTTDATAVLVQLEAIRQFSPSTKYLQCSTSELYGAAEAPEGGFTEDDINFQPRSPYSVAKLAAYWMVRLYRDAYKLHASNTICFNHESPRRGLDFSTRKITNGIARIKLGLADKLKMGNLDTFRDFGHASDYAAAMRLVLQQEQPGDYVVAMGCGATIKEVLEYTCELAGLNVDEVYELDERFVRPADVRFLLGNAKKLKGLGWLPMHDWRQMIKEMYENDLRLLGGGK